ncbi:MAG: GntR family transcriptional regulator [Lachnospiraceae bacterium]|nr:GntR family transcriptional regulator [Lachnospiraceae bacterium]
MILIDGRDHRPIYEQIVEKLSELMLLGGLENGAPVPSVRSLASELSVTPNTVQRAYAELERLGYIVSIRGKGSFVADTESIRRLQKEKIRTELAGLAGKAARAGISREELAGILKELPETDRGQTGGKHD